MFDRLKKFYEMVELDKRLSITRKSALKKSLQNAIDNGDLEEFFDMKMDYDEIKKISFPVRIYAPGYEPPSDEIIEEMTYTFGDTHEFEFEIKYLEQELAYWEGFDDTLDEEGTEKKIDYFREFKQSYKFVFHDFYIEIYDALKELDKMMKTNFATLFIESLMSYGTKGREISKHPVIKIAMAGAKFLMDREFILQEVYKKRNERRTKASDICKMKLEELL